MLISSSRQMPPIDAMRNARQFAPRVKQTPIKYNVTTHKKQHWLSEYIAGRSAVGVGHSGATARPAPRKESAGGVLVISLY
jgi:hypothetical protein